MRKLYFRAEKNKSIGSMKNLHSHLILLIGIIFCNSFITLCQDGKSLLKQNCSVCHKLGTRVVGPDLVGINEKRSEEWLLKFIKSSQTLIKSGDADAVAIFEEYNQMVMIDQPLLNDDQIKTILLYIKEESQGKDAQAGDFDIVEVVPIEYSENDIEVGKQLFSGKQRFINGGPSCITCHNVNNNNLISGGLLAKDLTNVYSRMGDAGLTGIIGTPPFPAMAASYKNNALDSTDVAQLTAFLKYADQVSSDQKIKTGGGLFIIGGGGGLIFFLLFIAMNWKNRLKRSVKHNIFKRQIKGSDSII